MIHIFPPFLLEGLSLIFVQNHKISSIDLCILTVYNTVVPREREQPPDWRRSAASNAPHSSYRIDTRRRYANDEEEFLE